MLFAVYTALARVALTGGAALLVWLHIQAAVAFTDYLERVLIPYPTWRLKRVPSRAHVLWAVAYEGAYALAGGALAARVAPPAALLLVAAAMAALHGGHYAQWRPREEDFYAYPRAYWAALAVATPLLVLLGGLLAAET